MVTTIFSKKFSSRKKTDKYDKVKITSKWFKKFLFLIILIKSLFCFELGSKIIIHMIEILKKSCIIRKFVKLEKSITYVTILDFRLMEPIILMSMKITMLNCPNVSVRYFINID